jgi:3-isopropylmalate/(R)-2-methylmalate dehydratase large subunit
VKTLLQKVWESHIVRTLSKGQDQIMVDTHLIHEVTSPQAFQMLRDRGLTVRYPLRTIATVDHIVPTGDRSRPLADFMAETMLQHLERNTRDFGIPFLPIGSGRQGIVHVVGPELGVTQPGTVIVCGDSHTSTHGAFGAISFGIGTTQVACVLATQTLLMSRPKARRIEITGKLSKGVTAKDVTLAIINRLGVDGGVGYAYEYAGPVIENMTMEERMTLCNMSIEGGARCGYVNPDQTTIDYLRDRHFSPKGEAFEAAKQLWLSFASDPDAEYDDVVVIDGSNIEPMVTWGINPGQSVGITGHIPHDAPLEALTYMKLAAGNQVLGTPISVAFIGSCTNGRIGDLKEAARIIQLNKLKVSSGVKALVVPGSEAVASEAKALGLDRIFTDAGWEWREAGCSMCLAMNPDKLVGDQLCVSSSNRNFKGRQGSPTGRTMLMSPASVVAAASRGCVADVRELILN